MGIFETLFGKKKRDTAAPKKAAAKEPASGPRGDSASAKEVVRYIFDQLAKGTSREAVREDFLLDPPCAIEDQVARLRAALLR